MFSKILPGGAAEQAGKLGEGTKKKMFTQTLKKRSLAMLKIKNKKTVLYSRFTNCFIDNVVLSLPPNDNLLIDTK